MALDDLPGPPQETRGISIINVGANDGHDSVIAAMARAAAASTDDLLCFLAPTSAPVESGWLLRLTAEIHDDVVAATPLLVHPQRRWRDATGDELRTRALGLGIAVTGADLPIPTALEAGAPADPIRPALQVAGASSACVVVDRHAYDAVGGLAALDDPDAAVFDLCLRLRARGGSVVAVPNAVVADHRRVRSAAACDSPIDMNGLGWQQLVARHGSGLRRQGLPPSEPLTFAVTVAAPSATLAPRWGDWQLAHALGRSLRRLGHPVRVQTADQSDNLEGRSCDVHVVIRGRTPISRTPGQRHVLWIISHPDSIDIRECDEADLVLVASSDFAAHLQAQTHTPVGVFLQATDQRRFRPRPPDPRHAHPVAVVAKTRDEFRPVVRDALAVGIRPAIYGTGWEAFVDPELVVASYVYNDELPAVYSSIGVLLNDHWGTMKSWGFVSNRLFDALACTTPVISDDLPAIHELFGDAIATYEHPADLRRLVDAALDDPAGARERAAQGRERVLAEHTFDHRAQLLVELLGRHDLASGTALATRVPPDQPVDGEGGPRQDGSDGIVN